MRPAAWTGSHPSSHPTRSRSSRLGTSAAPYLTALCRKLSRLWTGRVPASPYQLTPIDRNRRIPIVLACVPALRSRDGQRNPMVLDRLSRRSPNTMHPLNLAFTHLILPRIVETESPMHLQHAPPGKRHDPQLSSSFFVLSSNISSHCVLNEIVSKS